MVPIAPAGNPGRLFAGLLVVLLLAAPTGCSSKKISDKDLQFVDPADAQQLVQGRRRLLGLGGRSAGVWVDPRRESEFGAEHVPGAIHLPFANIATGHRALSAYDAVVVYGADFNSPVAIAMSKELMSLGHENVYTLRGGLRAWKAAGNAVEQQDGSKD